MLAKEIAQDIEKHSFKRLYLLYGGERFLMRENEEALSAAILPAELTAMNMNIYEGKAASAIDLMNSAETLPFLSEYRLLLLRDTGLFTAGRKDDSEALAEYLPTIPESTVMIFLEDKVDKRSRIYKAAAKAGRTVELDTPAEKELVAWVQGLFTQQGKRLATPAAIHLLRTAAHSMEAIAAESSKLISYVGDNKEVTKADIDAICTKALEARIFELMDAIGNKNTGTALELYANMLLMKESPIMILTMMSRQFRNILQCGYMAAKGSRSEEISAALGLRKFMVNDFVSQSKHFSMQKLVKLLEECLQTDENIKTGRAGDVLAVETLIVKSCM